MRTVGHCRDCATRRLCLGAGLGDESLDALSGCMTPSEPMQRGQYLYRAGDTAAGCYIVRSGAYKTVVNDGQGGEHVIGFHFPGEILALGGQSEGRHTDSAVALDTSTACRVPTERLPRLWSLGTGPSLLRLIGQQDQLSAQHQTNLARSGAEIRVAGFLVSLARRMERQGRDTESLPLPMSRTDLANHLGMTLECLSRIFARMTRAGVISAGRHHVIQQQPERLRALALGTADA
tara:strand:+ start:1478 stop:2182 length:705 start_codon:yes stop_codon:yes gene_type:complete